MEWPDELLEKDMEEQKTRKKQIGIAFLGEERKSPPKVPEKRDKDDVD